MELKDPLITGQEIDIEIAPTEGSYAATTVDGNDFVEKFSLESAKEIVENWKKDGEKQILCDIDHSSVDTNNTQAAGWITSLWVDEKAKRLMGKLQVSEKGAELLNGLEYRYISPVLLFKEDNFPYYLDSVSLTNTPRLQELKPVYNSRNFTMVNNSNEEEKMDTPEEVKEEVKEEIKEETPVEEVKEEIKEEVKEEVQEPVEEPVEEPKVDFITEVKGILGLPEEATEEDVKASVKEMVDKLKAIADKEIAEEAIEVVDACGVEDDKKEEVINCYKKSPELVRTVLNCFKKTPVKMVVNSEEAQKPELTEGEKLRREYESLKGGQDRVDFLLKNKNIKF